jgi:hypothetical protein
MKLLSDPRINAGKLLRRNVYSEYRDLGSIHNRGSLAKGRSSGDPRSGMSNKQKETQQMRAFSI